VELLVDQYQAVEAGDVLYRVRSPQWTELQLAIAAAEQEIASAEAEAALARARLAEARRRTEILRSRLETLSAAEFRRADLEGEAAVLEAGIETHRAEVQVAESRVDTARRARIAALARAAAVSEILPEPPLTSLQPDGRSTPAYQEWIVVQAVDQGIVERLALSDGAFAEPTAFVLSTIDPRRVRFRATSLQSDLSRLGGARLEETPARIVSPRGLSAPGGEAVTATMMLGFEAQPDQRTIAVLARPSDPRPWIRPGISAYLEVEVAATAGPALAIPRSAVVQDGLTHIFFRRDPRDPNKAIRVEADMGPSDGQWVVINSGLMHNDEVVLDGVYELKLAADRSGMNQRGGHFHADGTWHSDH
jgi:multidrug efflux pump subunit AcrA (membrane-fusion protein)